MESKRYGVTKKGFGDINSKFKSLVGMIIHDPQNFKLLPNDSITNRDSPISRLYF
jgi:hypothetical protein